jgi:3'-phosphoadenosine 5'-phosphosulfate sulfotransferase (PAPS reductase)/FAD synthetase
VSVFPKQDGLFAEPDFDPIADAYRILEGAIAEHRPSHVFAMFSGGNDSVCAAHLASLLPQFSGTVHIHTGIGIRETRRHAYNMAQRFGWPFRIYRPAKGNRYHELVTEHGFPGPFHHRKMYNRLKQRNVERLVREHKQHRMDKVMLVTGVRRQESKRRMGGLDEVDVVGAQVWVAPIINWSVEHKEKYMYTHAIPGNPVTAKLCMSGECLCGAFASPGELEEIRFWYPKAAAEIDRLAERCREAGVHAKWGTRPPPKPDERQVELPMTGHICWSCDAKFGNTEAA